MAQLRHQQQCAEPSPPKSVHNLVIDRFELATARSTAGASPQPAQRPALTASTALLLRARKDKAKADAAAKASQIEKIPASGEGIAPCADPSVSPQVPQIVEAAYTTWVDATVSVASTDDNNMPPACSKKPAPPSASSKAAPLSKAAAAPKTIEEPGTSAPGCFCFAGPRKIK